MSLDGRYDMILLAPPCDDDNGGRQPARRRRNRRCLPLVAEEQHPGVERVDGAGAPAGDTSGVDLTSETKTSAVSLQHANSKQTDDASTLVKDMLGVSLVKDMLGVSLVPETTPSRRTTPARQMGSRSCSP
jgi:hypothetical protein